MSVYNGYSQLISSILDCEKEELFGYAELTVEHYPVEIQIWLSKESSKKYVLEAYTKYLAGC